MNHDTTNRVNPPNWLLITFDQWRGDWLHQDWLNVPSILQIASQGWDIRRCYTSSPQCIPARASWITGLKPSQLGVTSNQVFTLPSDSPSFVRELKNSYGYHTRLIGKTHWTPHEKGVDLRDNISLLRDLGFDKAREIAGPRALGVLDCELTDVWREEGVLELYRDDLLRRYSNSVVHDTSPSPLPDHLYPDIWLGNVALEEINDLPKDSPWFFWISFPGPHEPFDVPISWRGFHGLIPPPEVRPDSLEKLDQYAPKGSVLSRKLQRWPDGIPLDSVSALRADYADHLHLLDSQVGKIMRGLEMNGFLENTAITICSDHGELLGDWGLLLKGCFLEGAIRSLFVHKPALARQGLRRLWKYDSRPYGLTEALWSAFYSIVDPGLGSFGRIVSSCDKCVKIEFEDESLFIK